MENDTKKKQSTNKSSGVKKNTTKKTNVNKNNTNKKTKINTNNKSTSKKANSAQKTATKLNSKSKTNTATKKVNGKKDINKKIDKELENTIIIENIEKEIEKIVENEEIKSTNDSAKLEDAKFTKKKDRKLLAIGIIIALLGIIALFISLVANRIVDREFISDSTITLMVIGSIIIECFGAFIIINET